jgi:hypothetical protein
MWSKNCLPFQNTWVHPRFLVGSYCSIVSFLHIFVDHCMCLWPLSFYHCVVCLSSISGFWLPLLVSTNFSCRRPATQEDTYGGGQRTTGAIQMANLARILGWRSQIGQANCSALILFFIIQWQTIMTVIL